MLTLKNLPVKNLNSYPGRTIAMLIFAGLMSAAVFGGMLIIRGLRQGLESVQSRLGADILVTPEDADNDFDAQTFLIQAEPGYFYMDASKLDQIRAVEGVETASPQMFLASATSSCCSAKLQIIAFDPDTDFTIQPWIRETFHGAQKLGKMDVIVGANVTVYDDHILRLYNNDCRVIGQFAPTGYSLDNAVYTDFETIKVLITSSFDTKLNKYQPFNTEDVISSVLVRVKNGYDAGDVANKIKNSVSGLNTTATKSMVSKIADSLSSISTSVHVFTIVILFVGALMTILIFLMMINERTREFASLRAMGASRNILSYIVIGEAVFINLLGGLIGIIASAVVIIGFSGVIREKLGIGFTPPSPRHIIIPAFFGIVVALLAAVAACLAAVKRVNRLDVSLVLKEGE